MVKTLSSLVAIPLLLTSCNVILDIEIEHRRIDELTVEFTAKGEDSAIVSTWEWDFGDSTSASGNPVIHQYSRASRFNIQLIGANGNKRGVQNLDLTLCPYKAKPIFKYVGCSDLEVYFADTNLLNYSINWGDGSIPNNDIRHSYQIPDIYTISITYETARCPGLINWSELPPIFRQELIQY